MDYPSLPLSPFNLILMYSKIFMDHMQTSYRVYRFVSKGPNTVRGYLKDPEKTVELIDKNGWTHSGDIGRWLDNGTLKIIDRRKHIFKLAQVRGEVHL